MSDPTYAARPFSKIAMIAGNNLRRLVRQPIMLFTTLALPFMIITVVGVALGGSKDQLDTGVVSHDNTSLSTQLIAGLRSSAALRVTVYHSDDALNTAVRRGQVSAGIEIPSGYGTALNGGAPVDLRLVTTPDQSNAASIRAVLQAVTDRQVETLQAAAFDVAHTGRDLSTEQQRAHSLAGDVAAPTITTQSVAAPKSTKLGFDYTAPSNLVLFVIITSLTSSAALIETRRKGITARMFTLPVGRLTVLIGELAGRFTVALAQALVILLCSGLAFGVSWGNPVGVGLLTIVLCAFGASLGLLVGFAARTMSQALSLGPPVGIALGMLGGCMWPLSIVGSAMRTIGHVTPDAWAMDGYLNLINDQGSVGDIAGSIGIVAAFAVAALGAALLLVRVREAK